MWFSERKTTIESTYSAFVDTELPFKGRDKLMTGKNACSWEKDHIHQTFFLLPPPQNKKYYTISKAMQWTNQQSNSTICGWSMVVLVLVNQGRVLVAMRKESSGFHYGLSASNSANYQTKWIAWLYSKYKETICIRKKNMLTFVLATKNWYCIYETHSRRIHPTSAIVIAGYTQLD